MDATLELKRSNLVLPTSGYELDREEMSYVEGGGLYVSFNVLQGATLYMFSALLSAGMPTAMAAISTATTALNFIKNTLKAHPVGWVFLALGAWILQDLPGALKDAFIQRKGIDIDFVYTTRLFGIQIPYKLGFNLR